MCEGRGGKGARACRLPTSECLLTVDRRLFFPTANRQGEGERQHARPSDAGTSPGAGQVGGPGMGRATGVVRAHISTSEQIRVTQHATPPSSTQPNNRLSSGAKGLDV
jgi:hypothetical protein